MKQGEKQTQEGKRKLFISFSSLLYAVKAGRVQPKDLEDGIFYFGCTKEHLWRKDAAENSDVRMAFCMDGGLKKRKNKREAERIYNIIRDAVFEAEKEGRATFRDITEMNRYSRLNRLLEQNGIDTSSVKHLEPGELCLEGQYSYPEVEEKYGGLVKVMWRNN